MPVMGMMPSNASSSADFKLRAALARFIAVLGFAERDA